MAGVKLKNPKSNKERGLIKGALRRVFSRSELRQQIVAAATIEHHDPERPRVTKWVFCSECGLIFPKYQAQVDHRSPLIPVDKMLEDLTWDEIVDRLWCVRDNLAVVDKDCHKAKSKEENKQRLEFKKGRVSK